MCIRDRAAPKHKGKISRVLAAKCALAVRVDALGEDDDATIGFDARAKVEARLRQLEGGNGAVAPATNGAPKKLVEVLDAAAGGGAGYSAASDMVLDDKKAKKEKKKRKKAEADDDDDDEAAAAKKAKKAAKKAKRESEGDEEKPKKKKKKKSKDE